MNPISQKCSTGVPGLDDVLGGGLPRNCLHLIEGYPGVGKTTLAMQFLLEGKRLGETCLYVTLSETHQELEAVAASHQWDVSGIEIIELSSIERSAAAGKAPATLFHSADMELTELTRMLTDEVRRIRPSRVVLDSLSEMRLLSQGPLRYRREVLSLKQTLSTLGCTALLLDDRSSDGGGDVQVHSIVHGALTLNVAPLRFGIFRRSLAVTKMRGVRFAEGNHDYVILQGGLRLFPRLIAADHHASFEKRFAVSNNAALDALLGGGLHYGTSNLFMGPAGTGKSTLASVFAHAAAARGERVLYYLFDETRATLCERAADMHIDLVPFIKSGLLVIDQMDPAAISPGELAFNIRAEIEEKKSSVVIIDSLNGYVNSMPDEDFLHLHLHELLTYLNQQGVMTIMILAQAGLVGPMGSPVDISYLADSVVLTRYFEALGTVRKALSIIKKRSGPHENAVRELHMDENGLNLGEPLKEFQGVLTGVPMILNGGQVGRPSPMPKI
jgi:circadian clock protein KaiC